MCRFPLRRGKRYFSGKHALVPTVGALLLILLAAVSPVRALVHTHSPKLHHMIEHLEEQYSAALLDGNMPFLNRVLAEDYVGIEPDGIIENKAQTLALWRSHAMHFDEMLLSDLHVRVYGNIAVVTSKAHLLGTGPNGPMNGDYRYTRVYYRRNGQWQIVSFEASRVHSHHPVPQN